MKRGFFLLVLCAAASLFARESGGVLERTLDAFLSTEQQSELVQTGCLLRSVYKENGQPVLVPPFAIPQALAGSWEKGNPSFLIEALYLYKKTSDGVKDSEKISRILRSVSQLKGLQYYSSSRKKMRTLYETSYVIDAPQTRNRVADPVDNTAADFSVYVLQKDLTFGENVYRYRFCSDADSSGFSSTNTDVLKYSVFKAIEPQNLEVSVSVTDLGEFLLIHALTRAQFTAPSVFRKRVHNSFKTRGEAVYGWFIARYGDAEQR